MGCCGSSSTYGIQVEEIGSAIQGMRGKYGSDVLIMAIKDQNSPGKLSLSGSVDAAMVEAITNMLQADSGNSKVECKADEYDKMWEYTWRNTKLTSGHSTFSMAKSYFPRGKIFVQLLDVIAGFGWNLTAAPNFGGVESRDDKGNVTSTVDWPVFCFYKETNSENQMSNEHLLFAVKDANVPGKLCAAGPVGDMEDAMTKVLGEKVKSEKDSYDDDYDVVWRNTSITSGASMMSFAKAYFPKGKTNVAMLDCAYSFGWRAVAAPNFGGQGDSWPCVIFRKVKNLSSTAPEILFASIKDSNQPGKLCFAGPSADKVTNAVCAALVKVDGNGSVKSEKDEYDADYDAVCRNVNITTGMAAFSLKLPYFPRCDSMTTVLNATAAEGFKTVACPNFGGMLDSWPTFILEKSDDVKPQVYLAVKDDNVPGKVGLGGANIASDETLQSELLDVLKTLCGPNVSAGQDDYDKSFELAFKNTVLTSGHATFTMAKPYWPHGFVIEMLLQVMFKHGFMAEGGPNFGDNGNTWPGIIFQKK
eukprot:gnl/MRDRNA2_/MRDRNA2_28359_c0_seq1.p1 gnl/MRDRNA2_/MRDRNA2_28359_c0~~gnl/MRDRNA2_/MRDRNA2_28359_c0_seq1.p1  ORF type:complete len:531 (-),score=107.91 gnl/MRDRNA2_/MRDRNA2_28359_c0_seq1:472-2064(-)